MPPAGARLFLLAAVLFAPAIAAQVGDTCSKDVGCGAGLHCSACGDGAARICTRTKPIDPATHVRRHCPPHLDPSKVTDRNWPDWVQGTGLPFNNYSWLTTHNSFALSGAPSATGVTIISPTNQEDTITAQLKVRPIPTALFALIPSRLTR
jgi:hypothetical protein